MAQCKEKDQYGEILYLKVERVLKPQDSSHTSLITGMLLERSASEIQLLLRDNDLLKMSVNLALRFVTKQNDVKEDQENKSSTSAGLSDAIADRLFEQVSIIEPTLAPRLTGMILELDGDVVKELLNNKEKLISAVMMAKKSLLAECGDKANVNSLHTHSCPPSYRPLSPLSNGHDRCEIKDSADAQKDSMRDEDLVTEKREEEEHDKLADIIYERAVILYRDHAPKICGMILEIDKQALQKIVADEELLDKAIAKAYSVLV